MGNVVGLVKVDASSNLKDSVSQVLDLIGFKPSASVKTVVVKPNLCYYWDASTGYTTDPRVVSGIIDYVREKFGDVEIKVAEADASAMRTKYAFPVLGYDGLAKEKNVELFNLSNDVLLDKTVEVNGRKISFKVPETLTKCDLFINVPKLKIMRATKITCAMKNIFGANGVVRKMTYHHLLDEAIVGMNMMVRPHLTVVDGLVGLGKFPKRIGLIMASTDCFSVDWVASKIMGYKPSSVRFLNLAIKEGLGTPNEVRTCGEKVQDFAEIFPREGFVASRYLWGLQFWLLSTYKKLSGDIIPPVLEE
jgi:uncharacterized protein (DUF362 family)